MNDERLRELLDGRPDPAAAARLVRELPPAERARARALLAVASAARAQPRPAPGPDFTAAVMARVRGLPPPRPRLLARLAGALPALRISPLDGAAAAAAAAFLALAVVRYPAPTRPEAAPGPSAEASAPAPGAAPRARLALAAPGARTVRVAGDFNGWRPEATPLARGADGVWRVEVPVEPGRRYEYMFVVDGSWVTDPRATARASDGFGGENAVLDT